MPTGQSWDIHHLPQQIRVNEVHGEPGRAGTREQQIICTALDLIITLALWFASLRTSAPPAFLILTVFNHRATEVNQSQVFVSRAGAFCPVFLLAQYKLQQSTY